MCNSAYWNLDSGAMVGIQKRALGFRRVESGKEKAPGGEHTRAAACSTNARDSISIPQRNPHPASIQHRNTLVKLRAMKLRSGFF